MPPGSPGHTEMARVDALIHSPAVPCLQIIPAQALDMRVQKLLEDSTSQMFKSLPNHLRFPSWDSRRCETESSYPGVPCLHA